MSTSITWNGTTYSVPASGETGWAALSNFLIDLGNNAAIAQEMKQAMRVATTTPVTVSDSTDCVIAVNLGTPGATTVNLPAGVDGRWFVVVDQKGDAATNNITITPNGVQTINGAASYVIAQNNDAVVLAYSSTNTRWNVIARFSAGSVLINPMATTGDMIYGGASGVSTKLATGATTGLLHGGNGAVPTWSLIVNADVSASAAIAGSKLVAAASGVAGAVSTGTQTMTGVKTFETQVIGHGTATNDDAAAGYIGEVLSASRARASAATFGGGGSGVDLAIVGPLSVTAGDWDIWCNGAVSTGASTVLSSIVVGISQSTSQPGASAFDGAGPTIRAQYTYVVGTNGDITYPVSPIRVSLSTTTSYYMVMTPSYTGSAPAGYGTLWARRRR